MIRLDLRRRRFGRLRVERLRAIRCKAAYWCCVCDCGTKVSVRSSKLISGRIVSCGCARRDPEVRRKAMLSVPPDIRQAIARAGGEARKAAPKSAARGPRYSIPLPQVAQALNVAERVVGDLAASGTLDGKLRRGVWWFSRADIELFAGSCQAADLPRANRCGESHEGEERGSKTAS